MNAVDFSAINVGCFGKRGYDSKADAMQAIHFQAKRGSFSVRDGCKGLQAYRCENCPKWHVGTRFHGR